MNVARTSALGTLLTGFAVWLVAGPVFGQYRDNSGEMRQTVARISYVAGDVSFLRGDDPDNWQPADRNVPMTLGDRVYTGGRGRLELQLQGRDVVRLGTRTDLAALNLTDDTKQFSLNAGIASFRIRRLFEDENFEVDTPNAAVTFETPGDYRVDVDLDGNTRVTVRRGRALVAAGGGQVPLQAGDEMDIDGIDNPRYEVLAMARSDDWDRWVADRENRTARARSYTYVSADVVGADDLDEYGRWEYVPQYGRCWTPNTVAAGWAPYRVGHWIWQDPWGWTWVSAEPWGWAPYHYGRWVTASSRWYWVPVAPQVRYVTYAPALVAFVGGGSGWSASVAFGSGGYIGWFPLAPRDPFVPWWERRSSVNVNVTNVTYVNRTYVTVVNRNTFVSGGVVTSNVVQDRSVVSQVAAAAVVNGPVPALPTRQSLHVAVRADVVAAPRPPAQVAERAVVARVAPPPAPPSFQAKLDVIREQRGAPVAPDAAARISVENRGRARAVTEVHPVAPDPGRVTLAPRGRDTAAAAAAHSEPVAPVAPVAPVRGREMATTAHPVSSSPVTTSAQPSRERVERQAPPAPPAQPAAPAQERLRGRPENVPPPPPAATAVPPPPAQERLRGRPERAAPPPPPPPQATAAPPPPQQERLRGRPERSAPPQATPTKTDDQKKEEKDKKKDEKQ